MRMFMACLSTETNTFCDMPTARSGFEDFYMRRGTATEDTPNLMTEALHLWRSRAQALGWDVTESLSAIAEPAGLTVASTYNALSSAILDDLETAGGADVVLLQLHGAMVAEHVEDCEGDIVARVRAKCPDAVIGLALDNHCHLTQQMMQACDLIICFKEYPHDDATARAADLFEMARRTRAGEITPVMREFDCRMVNIYLTKQGAMERFVARMHALEDQPGILSVSLAHGFPWADVADVGARTLVIADGDAALAERTAEELGRRFFDERHAVTMPFLSLPEALDIVRDTPQGPIVLADMGDNSGAGGAGDATFVLSALIARGTRNVATGLYWDPVAVRLCSDAGEGARIRLRLGGKLGPNSGDPIDLEARVMKIATGLGQHLGPGLEPLGTMVWLRVGEDVDIVVNDLRTQVYHPEAFEQLGIDLSTKHLVVVKSLFHFHAPFAEIASQILMVATKGGSCPAFRDLSLTRRKTPYWPKVENPFSDSETSDCAKRAAGA